MNAMPAATDSRTKRLLDLVVLLLDAKHPVPYAELREQFSEYRSAKPEAGMRAFERDKATLLELGVPIRWITAEENEAAGDGGYIIDRQKYRLPEVTLTPDEVAALVVTASAARHQPEFPYRHAAEMAVRKLMFDLAGLGRRGKHRRRPPGEHARSDDTDGSGKGVDGLALAESLAPRELLVHMPSTYHSRSLGEYLAQLEEAIRLRKRVTIHYDHHRSTPTRGSAQAEPPSAQAPTGDGVPQALTGAGNTSDKWYVKGAPSADSADDAGDAGREVDPYGLVYRQGAWLLVGHCHTAGGVRRFRVDRITDLKVAPRPKTPDFEVPPQFSLQEHGSFSPWRFDREAQVAVQLFVSAEVPWVAEEDFGEALRSPAHDGDTDGVVVSFQCGNPEYLIGRVLGSAGALRVLAPEQLRRRVAESATAVARRNHGHTRS